MALSSLAAELIGHIVQHLEPADIASLRLVCRELYQKSLYHASRRLFRTVWTDLSRHGLQKLEELSRHEELRDHVQILAVRDKRNLGHGFTWPRHGSGHLIAPLQLPPVRMLQELLLSRLVNCRSFHFYSSNGDQFRDDMAPSDAVAILFAIIAETGLSIKSFHVGYQYRVNGGLGMHMTRLSGRYHLQGKFPTAWCGLQDLAICQILGPHNYDWSMTLITGAPRLQKLTLDFADGIVAGRFLLQLSSENTLTELQELSLSHCVVMSEHLTRFLFCYNQSLHTLRLAYITIKEAETWGSVFTFLRENFPLLRIISISGLTVAPYQHLICRTIVQDPYLPGLENEKFQVTFGHRGWKRFLEEISYCGPRMDVALSILEKEGKLARTDYC